MIYNPNEKLTVFEALDLDIEETEKYLTGLVESIDETSSNFVTVMAEALNSDISPQLRLAIMFFWGRIKGRDEGFEGGFKAGCNAVVRQAEAGLAKNNQVH